uniref:Centrosomin N-terminal motif 1 domain-containing protein n=1 Tax=Micrurus corallinus TaxID=54390 RepID=A0A2D4FAP1_MICCO
MSNGYRTLSQHLNDLKKENFSLKLRIYFLEECIQQKYEDNREDIYRQNIELKVEVESLKQELQEKQQSLEKAWTEAENQSNKDEAEICHLPKDKHVYETLGGEIQTLHENMFEANQQLTYCDMSFSEEEIVLNDTEHMEKNSSLNAMNKQLQDKMNEMDFELKSLQHASKKQDHIIQKLKEMLKSKENEIFTDL